MFNRRLVARAAADPDELSHLSTAIRTSFRPGFAQRSFIRPGKPLENACIESFSGKFRDECLNEHWFLKLQHTRGVIERWRVDCNTEKTHGSLGDAAMEMLSDALQDIDQVGVRIEAVQPRVAFCG